MNTSRPTILSLFRHVLRSEANAARPAGAHANNLRLLAAVERPATTTRNSEYSPRAAFVTFRRHQPPAFSTTKTR